MTNPKWTTVLGLLAMLASVPAAIAAETGSPAAPKDAPRIASARPAPAPAGRPASSGTVPGMIGERPYAPAERMADSIAEFYASGKLRIY